jgi:hypothetical protein
MILPSVLRHLPRAQSASTAKPAPDGFLALCERPGAAAMLRHAQQKGKNKKPRVIEWAKKPRACLAGNRVRRVSPICRRRFWPPQGWLF